MNDCNLCANIDNALDTIYGIYKDCIVKDENTYTLVVPIETNEWSDYDDSYVRVTMEREIKYCPDCGRKL